MNIVSINSIFICTKIGTRWLIETIGRNIGNSVPIKWLTCIYLITLYCVERWAIKWPHVIKHDCSHLLACLYTSYYPPPPPLQTNLLLNNTPPSSPPTQLIKCNILILCLGTWHLTLEFHFYSWNNLCFLIMREKINFFSGSCFFIFIYFKL